MPEPRVRVVHVTTVPEFVQRNIPGCREVVKAGESGLLIPVGDAEGLAAAIARTLDDPAGAAERAAVAERFVRASFSHDADSEWIWAAYVELTRHRRPTSSGGSEIGGEGCAA